MCQPELITICTDVHSISSGNEDLHKGKKGKGSILTSYLAQCYSYHSTLPPLARPVHSIGLLQTKLDFYTKIPILVATGLQCA